MENLPSPHPRYSASPAEIETGKRVVAELGLKIESLEREIKELTNRLLPLQRQRTNHLSYISPLRCLPDEVLVEILITCVQEGVKVTNLSQICGRIRDIIIRTPILWSYIHLVPKYQGSISEHRVYNTCHPTNSRELKWALTCAKATPLRLYLEIPVESTSLSSIIRRNSPIYSLTVVVRGDFIDNETGIFSGLDMSPLKELHLIRMDDAGIEHLMDMALHSGTGSLTLSLNFSRARILQHLQHKLIHRVTHLHIITGQLGFRRYSIQGTRTNRHSFV
ncbi:hypothetical protein CPB86DRAFT_57047 [Serendipita vermifera]|nr:hypothetical protein CPB86DRAFT_57047 [Serendipita vermifera]